MVLRMDLKRIGFLTMTAIAVGGCRFVSVESFDSASAPNKPSPEKGDPYAFGGIADGTGGNVAATTQTMESESYSGPKFKQVAGNEAFTSMSGHSVSKAKPNDTSGDYQPLPNGEKHEGGEAEH